VNAIYQGINEVKEIPLLTRTSTNAGDKGQCVAFGDNYDQQGQ